ncbi:MAG: hypothetical protein AB7I50_20475 [Vicinamibacterales bacterium]
MRSTESFAAMLFALVLTSPVQAQQVQPDDLGVVEAPTAGSYEIRGEAPGGRLLEADVRGDGVLVELEIQVGQGQVPQVVQDALEQYAPGFVPATEQPRIEKSVRPSAVGLPEIWYEFSGQNFDVEIRSDGKALLIEPASFGAKRAMEPALRRSEEGRALCSRCLCYRGVFVTRV